jgi:molecular chaperone GrpE
MMPKDQEEEKEKTNDEIKPEDELPEATMTLEEELAEAKRKAEEYLANWQRAQADFINYKRRTEQERIEFNSYANASLLCAILPVLDDFERALKAVPKEYKHDDWVEGVRLVEKKFKTILEGLGVREIKCLGQPFDPNLHEAIRQEKGKEGIVVGEHLKGYTLNDKLLRAARVAVGSGEGHTKKTHTKEESEETKEAE